jgi:hypothetical protein
MKVVVQDSESGRYLSPDGRWVATADGARDFHSILPAFHFAQSNTSVRFRVMLYCPDDQYLASMIDGAGTAKPAAPKPQAPAAVVRTMVRHPRFDITSFPEVEHHPRFHLN